MSFRTLARISWANGRTPYVHFAYAKFPYPREDLGESNVETGLNETKTSLFPYPREDFGGANAEWAKKRAKTFMFPSPREDFWGANEGLTEVANKAKEFPSPREDWGVLTGPSSYDCSSSV